MNAPDSAAIPENPGVYLYKDGSGRILYVGKAKNLRRRVLSYFAPGADHAPKTRAMLAAARSLDFLITATEKEALLLEAGLIKKHRPRYNIVLRDDKGYVLFKLDKGHEFPRLALTRRVVRDGSAYYGPFTSAHGARETLKAVHALFPLRRCKDAVFRNRVRPCLYHHMGLCLGPCCLEVDPARYAELVRGVELLLAGRTRELIERLTADMRAASEALRFEKAAELRDRIQAVRATVERQSAVLARPRDLDVMGVAAVPGGEAGSGGGRGGVSLELLFVRRGLLIDKRNFFWPGAGPDEVVDVVGEFVLQHYRRGRFVPEKIVLPPSMDDEERIPAGPLAEALTEIRGARVSVGPPRGPDERRLSEMARANAAQSARAALDGAAANVAANAAADAEEGAADETGDSAGARSAARAEVLARLAAKLGLPGPPARMEAVDISHTGGAQARAGLVVFEHGAGAPDQYRAYGLERAAPGDDYGALAEWAERRVASGPPWPDLLVVDGGRGQLAAVARALHGAGVRTVGAGGRIEGPGSGEDRTDGIGDGPEAISGAASPVDDMPVWRLASVAKEHAATGAARRHGGAEDRVFVPGRANPVPFRAKDPALLLLRNLRDAVHRFSITSHRKARGRRALGGTLTTLPGVGPRTARLLWERYDGLADMVRAGENELAQLPGFGEKKARALWLALRALAPDGGPEAGVAHGTGPEAPDIEASGIGAADIGTPGIGASGTETSEIGTSDTE
jgi:excinuclease ABC subunit C